VNRRRIARIAARLETVYGVPPTPRHPPDPLDSLVCTILSQNTNDRNRDRAFGALLERFPCYEDVLAASHAVLRTVIAPAGLQDAKAHAIHNALAWTRARFGALSLASLHDMATEEIITALVSLKGVGLKTAHVVAAMSLDRDVFPLDTHCLRILKRLEVLPTPTTLDQAHRVMAGQVPRGKARAFHLNLIRHGREVCHARHPSCRGCALRRSCPVFEKGNR
jgi:endonuclease-3